MTAAPTNPFGSGFTLFFNVVDAAFRASLSYARTALTGLTSIFSGVAGAVGMFTGAIGLAAGALRSLSDAYKEQEEAETQLQAALNATGKQTEVNVRDIANYASELEKVTKFSDEAIISSVKWFAQLRRFPAAEIKRAVALSLDMAEVMGEDDPKASTQRLARALEDPRRASRSLRAAGVMINSEERQMIETLDKAGNYEATMQAIFRAVERAVGGSAEMMAKTMEGQQKQLYGLMEDLKKFGGYVVNEFALPIVSALRDSLREWSDYFDGVTDGMKKPREELTQWMQELGKVRGEIEVQAGMEIPWQFSPEQWAELNKRVTESTSNLQVWGEQIGMGIRMGGELIGMGLKALETLSFGLVAPTDDARLMAEQKNRERALNTEMMARRKAKADANRAEADAEAKWQEKEENERIAREKAAEEAEKDRIRTLERKWNEFYESLDRRQNTYYEKTRSEEEKAIDRVMEIRQLWDWGYLKGPQGTDLYLRSMDLIRKDYVDAADYMKEIEKSTEKVKDDKEKLADIDKKLAKESEFSATIESLSGLWAKIQTSAASRKTDPIDELRAQRKDLADQANTREQQLNELIRLQREREQFAGANFG